jgi:hypothetical protein
MPLCSPALPLCPLLLCCSTAARRFRPPRHLLLPSPTRVAPSPSATLASPLLASRRLPRPSPFLPELPLSDSSPPLWQIPASPPFPRPVLVTRELLLLKPFPFLSFSFVARTPSTKRHRRPFLNFGILLFAVGSPPQSSPHNYNPLGSFPSPH